MIYAISYKGRKKGSAFQASGLDFDLDDLKIKQGRKKFTYRDPSGVTRELFVDTDEVLDVAEIPEPPGSS